MPSLLLPSVGLGCVGGFLLHHKFFKPVEHFNRAEDRRKAYPPSPEVMERMKEQQLERDPTEELRSGEFPNGGKNWTIEVGFFPVKMRNDGGEEEKVQIYYQFLLPRDIEKCEGIVVLYHGYADNADFLGWNQGQVLRHLTNCAVVIFDQPGNGRSDGLWAYYRDWFDHVLACRQVTRGLVHLGLKKRLEEKTRKEMKVVGMGISMGGAILACLEILHNPKCEDLPQLFKDALKEEEVAHSSLPSLAPLHDGAILVSPMVKVSDKIKPHWVVQELFVGLASAFPTWPVTPTGEVVEKCFKNPEFFREFTQKNPFNYTGKPRLRTAVEVLRAQDWIYKNKAYFTCSTLMVHGADDVVTDPESTKDFFAHCGSGSKSLKIYPGAWHTLTSGAPKEECAQVYRDLSDFITKTI